MALVVILLALAGAGIGVSVVLSGANMVTGFIGMAAVLVAAIGIVSASWLAPRSARAAIACGVIALAGEALAALLLLTSPQSNSHFWVVINIGRFGGVLVAALGLALTVHAGLLGRLALRRAGVLVLVDMLAFAIGAAIAGWETRS